MMDGTGPRNITIGDQHVPVGSLKKPDASATQVEKDNFAKMEGFLSNGDLSPEELAEIAQFDGKAGLSQADFALGGMKAESAAGFKVCEAEVFFDAARALISTQSGGEGKTLGVVDSNMLTGNLTAGATANGFAYANDMSESAHATLKSLENEGGLITRNNLEAFVEHPLTEADCKEPTGANPKGGALYAKLKEGGFTDVEAKAFCDVTKAALADAEIKVPTGTQVPTGAPVSPKPLTIKVDDMSRPIYTEVTGPQVQARIDSNPLKDLDKVKPNGQGQGLMAQYTVGSTWQATGGEISHNLQLVNKPIVDRFTVVNPVTKVKELDYVGFHTMMAASFPDAKFTFEESKDMLNLMKTAGNSLLEGGKEKVDPTQADHDQAAQEVTQLSRYLRRIPELDTLIGDNPVHYQTDAKDKNGDYINGPDVQDAALNFGKIQAMAALSSLVTNPPKPVTYEKKTVPNPDQAPVVVPTQDPGQTVSLDFTFGAYEFGTVKNPWNGHGTH